MRLEKIMGGVLNSLSGDEGRVKTHNERKRINKTAYSTIRGFYDNPEDIKYWDDYYQSAKRK